MAQVVERRFYRVWGGNIHQTPDTIKMQMRNFRAANIDWQYVEQEVDPAPVCSPRPAICRVLTKCRSEMRTGQICRVSSHLSWGPEDDLSRNRKSTKFRTRVARFSREVAQHQGKAHLQSQGARGASDRGGGGGLVAGITDLAARDQLQRASSFFGRQL